MLKYQTVKMSQLIATVSLSLFIYLYLIYSLFLTGSHQPEYPILRHRLGTILSHSSDYGGSAHTYCYYPKSSAEFSSQSEYILKRAYSLNECSSWLGVSVFYEAPWVSEADKLWIDLF